MCASIQIENFNCTCMNCVTLIRNLFNLSYVNISICIYYYFLIVYIDSFLLLHIYFLLICVIYGKNIFFSMDTMFIVCIVFSIIVML